MIFFQFWGRSDKEESYKISKIMKATTTIQFKHNFPHCCCQQMKFLWIFKSHAFKSWLQLALLHRNVVLYCTCDLVQSLSANVRSKWGLTPPWTWKLLTAVVQWSESTLATTSANGGAISYQCNNSFMSFHIHCNNMTGYEWLVLCFNIR